MGLTKEYSRFSASGDSFGLIASPDSCVRFLSINNVHDKFIATSGCQHINIWDFKTHHLVGTLGSSASKITCFEVVSTSDPLIAVGHADGSIVVYDYVSRELKCTLNGHKNAVTCLAFDPGRMRLVSGGKDTTLIVWDLVNESGLFKLKGHKNVITQCRFMKHHNYLISSSKDGFIKFWDLDSQHCFKTFIAHRTQILDFVLFRNDTRLITGSDELKVWKILQKDGKAKHQDAEEPKENQPDNNSDSNEGEDEDQEDETCIFSVKSYGSILRESTSNFRGFTLDPNEKILLCRGKDSTLECFKIRSRDEVKDRLQKKARKQRKHLRKLQADQQDDQDQETKINITLTLSDEIERMKALQAGHKIRFCDISSHKNFSKVALLLLNNSVELFSMNLIDFSASKLTSLETEGHRSNVRTVAFSSDNLHIASTSDESLKIWNRKTRCCVTTISESYEATLCSAFVQSDRFVVTGTKTGKLQIFDLGEASITQTIEASEEGLAIRSLCLDPDGKGLVTGSEDKKVKFWEFQFVKHKNNKKLTLTLTETRTLDLSEEVLCVKISPNGKFIAVSLLDSSVKIFYVDTLRFFLTLYGHKLPILAMDISHDSRLIATGSSDKNLKLWGLDFGDCHKSIFAHDLAITSVNFIPRTHHLFTSSNDKTIKLWDADNFEKIIALKGHQGEVLCTAVSPNGKHLVSASHDKTLRLWEETDEPLILEEEREMEREEEMFNENDLFDNHVIPGESNQETSLATKSTKESVIATERLIEAIEIFNSSSKTLLAHQKLCDLAKDQGKKAPPAPTLHPLMVAYNTDCPHRFMLKTLMKIKSSEIQEALISLPFNNVIDMIKILCEIIERQWEREAMIRIACFLIRTHFGQISSTPNLLPAIDKIRLTMKPALTELKDLFGFNLSALEYLQSELEARNEVKFFLDLYEKREKSKKNRKKARKVIENAPILSLK